MMKFYFVLFFIFQKSIFSFSQPEAPEIKYTPFSTTVIALEVINDFQDSVYVEASAVTIIPRGRNTSKLLPLIRKGTYYLNFVIDRPLQSQFYIDDEKYNILVVPNDTTTIVINPNGKKNEISFKNNYKAINQYYLKKKLALGYTDIRIPMNGHLSSRSTYQSVKSKADSVTSVEKTFLDHYTTSIELPKWFTNYENASITYAGSGFKTGKPLFNETFKTFNDELPDNYFDFLKEIEINNETAILSHSYIYFLDSYFIKDIPDDLKELSGFERSSKIRAHTLPISKNELTNPVKEIFQTYNFCYLLRFYTDSLEIDSLAKVFEVNNYQKLLKESGKMSKAGIEKLNLQPKDTIPNFYTINEIDSLISFRSFKNKIIYINFWATWCGPCLKNMPQLNEMIASYKDNPNIEFLNICIDSENQKWLATIDKYNIAGTNLIAAGKWNDKLRSYFNIKGIPQYVIVGKDNVLIENFSNKAPRVTSKIDEILNK